MFGSKAVGLGQALRDGLPVPPGFALAGPIVEAVAAGDEDAIERSRARSPARRAVRRALVGRRRGRCRRELRRAARDAPERSVGRRGRHGAREIWWSANSDSAITYRKRVGLFTRPSVAVVVQGLLDPETAGVMFTRNPITGADERMIEASWGSAKRSSPGSSSRTATASPATAGCSSAARAEADRDPRRPGGGTVEEEVPPELAEQLCLDDAHLGELNDLATRVRGGLRPGPRHRVGDRRRHALPAPVPRGDEGGGG